MMGRIALAGRRYSVERDFGPLPAGMKPARISQVAVDSEGHIHVLRRGDPPVLVFTSGGAFLRAYGEDAIFDLHGISIDARNRVWVVDRDAHEVIVFDINGKPALKLGERHRPAGPSRSTIRRGPPWPRTARSMSPTAMAMRACIASRRKGVCSRASARSGMDRVSS